MMHADLNREYAHLGAHCPMCRDLVPVDVHPFVGRVLPGDFAICRNCGAFLTVASIYPLRLEMTETIVRGPSNPYQRKKRSF